jgi:hypothetical protein
MVSGNLCVCIPRAWVAAMAPEVEVGKFGTKKTYTNLCAPQMHILHHNRTAPRILGPSSGWGIPHPFGHRTRTMRVPVG